MNKPTVYIIHNSNSPSPKPIFNLSSFHGLVIVGNSFLSAVHIEFLLANYHLLLKLIVTNTYLDDTKAYNNSQLFRGQPTLCTLTGREDDLDDGSGFVPNLPAAATGAAVVKQEEELLVT